MGSLRRRALTGAVAAALLLLPLCARTDEGSGAAELLEERGSGAGAQADAIVGVRPRSPEEAHYLEVFASVFARPEAMVANLGRWLPPEDARGPVSSAP